MSRVRNNVNNQNNGVPKTIFFPQKVSRWMSVVLAVLIDIITIYYAVKNANDFTSQMLVDTVNVAVAISLAVVAMAIAIFQTDKGLFERINTDSNIKKIYESYAFGIFPYSLIFILSYVIAYAFAENAHIICLGFVMTIIVLTQCIIQTITSFVAFLNIRD